MNKGFIIIHRQLLGWEWYDDINTKVLFIHCLLKANYKPKRWQGININVGQFVTSYGKLSNETGLSVQMVRTCLKKLESTNELTIKTTNRNSIITVVKYVDYQSKQQASNKQATNDQQTNNNQSTTTNKDNKENNVNKETKKKGVPPSFESFLNHAREKAKDKNIILDEEKVRTKFDSWLENDWCDLKGNKILNWKVKITSNLTYWQGKKKPDNFDKSHEKNVMI